MRVSSEGPARDPHQRRSGQVAVFVRLNGVLFSLFVTVVLLTSVAALPANRRPVDEVVVVRNAPLAAGVIVPVTGNVPLSAATVHFSIVISTNLVPLSG